MVYILIYLFVISFKLLKLRWIYSAKRESFRQITVGLPRYVAKCQICRHSYIFLTPQSIPVTGVVIT